jgi:hypothetical protein
MSKCEFIHPREKRSRKLSIFISASWRPCVKYRTPKMGTDATGLMAALELGQHDLGMVLRLHLAGRSTFENRHSNFGVLQCSAFDISLLPGILVFWGESPFNKYRCRFRPRFRPRFCKTLNGECGTAEVRIANVEVRMPKGVVRT